MGKDDIWDYSPVPPREWKWKYKPDVSCIVKLSPAGLAYYGDDDYWGGYIAGFQTIEEFLRDGPLENMPETIAVELRAHLKTHRTSSGAFLRFHYTNKAGSLKLWRTFVRMDEITINAPFQGDRSPEIPQEEVFFEGSCSVNEHRFSLAFIFQDIAKAPVEKWILYVKFDVKITSNDSHSLELETSNFHKKRIETRAILDETLLPLYDLKFRRYTSE